MNSLEQQIARWRQQMEAAGVRTPVPLDELEAHLRDEIARHLQAGGTEADAFASAVAALGPAHVMAEEFNRVESRREILRFRFLEILYWSFTSLFGLSLSLAVLRARTGGWSELTTRQQMVGLAAMMMFLVFAWGGRLGYQRLPVFRSRRVRGAVTAVCVGLVGLWWTVFLRGIAPHNEWAMGQFLVAFLWAFVVPGGLMIGLIWGLEVAARGRVQIQP